MRVVLLANTVASMKWFRQPFMRALRAAGHSVWVLAPDGAEASAVLACGCSFIPVELSRGADALGGDLQASRDLYRLFRTLRPDLVLTYTVKASALGVAVARAARVPRVHAMLTGLGHAFYGKGDSVLKTAAYQSALAGALRLCDSVVVLNQDNRELLLRKRIVPEAKLELVPGEGIDLTAFDVAYPSPTPEALHFLMVARLVVAKGVREFVQAAQIVKARYPRCTFSIAGDVEHGRHPDAIPVDELETWRAQGQVRLLGYISDIKPVLSRADCFVLPSHAEGLPMSTMEAMAMGKPVITTKAPGTRDTVEDGRNGYLVPVGEAAALAQRMIDLIEQPELVTKFGRESRRMAETKFSSEVINAQLMSHLGLS